MESSKEAKDIKIQGCVRVIPDTKTLPFEPKYILFYFISNALSCGQVLKHF